MVIPVLPEQFFGATVEAIVERDVDAQAVRDIGSNTTSAPIIRFRRRCGMTQSDRDEANLLDVITIRELLNLE